MMDNSFIPFSLPSITKEEEDAVLRVMRSGWLTTGKEASSFEQEFSAFTGTPHSLAVNSATSGLMLALDAFGIGPGTKVLTTPYTFISTASAALHTGAGLAYADIEKDSYSIDPAQIEKKLKEDSSIKAVIPVHIAGNLCNMEEICGIAHSYGAKVIEDAAHAFPSKTAAGYAGTLGDAGVFSFYATKTITTAEGGMVCTANPETAARMTTMRMHGIDRTVWDRYTSSKASWEYDVIAPGWKFNMPDMLAAVGRIQLTRAQDMFERRSVIVKQYNEAFAPYSFFELPPYGPGNAWHIYMLRLNLNQLNISRNEFCAELQKKGIGISMHFIPHFHMTYWKNTFGLKVADFPYAEQAFQRSLSIPLWPDMNSGQVQRVIDAVIETGTAHYGS